jgi:peptidoglycan/LPS O-acetylase OafA/YrhL
MGRRKALDGMRAIAVLAVVASHTFSRAEGGFLGVDVFFVLSGYLITSLLLGEWHATGRIDLVAFYRRRVVRLAPAYLFMLALAVPMMIGPLRGQIGWPVPVVVGVTLVYLANWADVINSSALGPIGHTWSLAIEEQFYLLWPAAFILLTRRGRPLARWLAAAGALIVAARAIGWMLVPGSWPYFATVTHGDGLLIGCLLAVWLRGRSARPAWLVWADHRSEPLAWAAGAGLGILMVVSRVDNGSTYLASLLLAGLATAVMVRHVAVADDGPMVRLLSWAPLVAIGRVSYGLYLFHYPVFHLIGHLRIGYGATVAVEYTLSAALTGFSWFIIERPAQRWAHRRWQRPHVTLDNRAAGHLLGDLAPAGVRTVGLSASSGPAGPGSGSPR